MRKELIKRMIAGCLEGVVISYFVTIGISLIMGEGMYYACVPSLIKKFGNEINAVIVQTLLSAVLGGVFGGASIIWERDEWSLLKQTGIYFALITTVMMSVAYVCEWMEHTIKGAAGYFGIFFSIFVVIWIIRYLTWKIRITNLRKEILNRK